MVKLGNQKRVRDAVCREIASGIEGARSDDTGGLKFKIIGYLLADTKVPLTPTIGPDDSKDIRGWNHPVTAGLLCPIEHDANESTYANIRNGTIKVTASKLPRFLYPDGYVYDPEDPETMEAGLLRGHLLIRVAKHIFMGPSAALKGPGYKRGTRGNAIANGMTNFTPRAIAYTAVQARFALSSMPEWSSADGDFDYPTFYWGIVALFDDGECKDILRYFDSEVFGTSSTLATPADREADEVPAPSSLQALKASRAAKRARNTHTITTTRT